MRSFAMVLAVSSVALAGCEGEVRSDAEGGEARRTSAGPAEVSTPLELTLENINRRNGGARDVAVSPDGAWLAVTRSGPETAGIYLLPSEPDAGDAVRWVSGGSPAWSPDNGRIAYVEEGRLRVAERGDTEGRVLVENLEGLRDPVWSPDGTTIAFYSTADGAQDIWLVSSSGGEPRKLTDGAAALDDGRFEPAWSPAGDEIAFISNQRDYWADDVWIVDVDSGRERRVSGTLMASSTPVWSPDGNLIALMGTATDEYWYQDLAYLYVLDPAQRTERIVDMQVYATDFIMRHRPIWSADGATLYFPYHERGAFDLWAVPSSGGVATRVSNLGGSWSALDSSRDGTRFALVRSGQTEGSEAWTLAAAGGPASRRTAFSPTWEGVRRPLEVSYRSFDGLYIQGFLYLPPDVREARDRAGAYDGASCPALVQVHGGGTNSYYQGLSLTEQYLASRGFVVLAINYRGGSGFGREFQDLNVEDWLNDQAKDPGPAADWLRSQPFVSGRVGVYGGSYGGSMSLAAVTRTPDKFDAAVPMRGAYSKSNTLEHTDRLGNIFTITGHGGTPEERPEIYAKSNTVDRLEAVQAPLLLMHGELDRRVPIQHFELAVERLRELGKDFETHTYPTEAHGFRDPANRIDMYSRLEAFFREHLGECTAD